MNEIILGIHDFTVPEAAAELSCVLRGQGLDIEVSDENCVETLDGGAEKGFLFKVRTSVDPGVVGKKLSGTGAWLEEGYEGN